MKKVHLTESQIKYIKKCLKEIDAKKTLSIDAETDAMGKTTQQSLTDTKTKMQSIGMQDASIKVDPNTLSENYACFTKKQLKEARLAQLRKLSKCVSKKNFLKESAMVNVYDVDIDGSEGEQEAIDYLHGFVFGECETTQEPLPSNAEFIENYQGVSMYFVDDFDNGRYIFVEDADNEGQAQSDYNDDFMNRVNNAQMGTKAYGF